MIPGTEVVGFKKTYRKGQANERVVYRVRRPDNPTQSEDLPEHCTPALFRPTNLAKYPDPLPEPATLTAPQIPWQSEHPEYTPADDPSPLDWIGPYNLPPNICREEAEIRVLRGLKTELARGVDERARGPKSYDSILGKMLDAVTPAPLVAKGWVPDKRDIGDWLNATRWLRHVEPVCASIIRFKAQDYSFRQIAGRFIRHLQRESVRQKYHEGIDQVTRVANQGAKR